MRFLEEQEDANKTPRRFLFLPDPDNTCINFTDQQFTELRTDLAIGDLNPYFGGVHAVAYENGKWVGAADPRRDDVVKYAQSLN